MPKSKLFNLKEWLTLADAARHLSILFGEEVSEADVLRLALDGRLRLSVRFVNHAQARKGRLLPLDECPLRIMRREFQKGMPLLVADNVKENELAELSSEIRDGLKTGELVLTPMGLHYREGVFLLLDKNVVSIEEVWDLPLLGCERLDVEHLYQAQTGGPPVTLTNLDGTFVERDGVVCQLQEDYEANEFHPGSKAQREAIEERIENGELDAAKGKEALERHQTDRKVLLERRRKEPREQFFYPSGSLPADAVYVVRTSALRDFEQALGVAKPLTAREEATYLNIVGGLLDLLLGKTPSGKAQSSFMNQASVIDALLVRFERKPGMSKRTLEEKLAQAKRHLASS